MSHSTIVAEVDLQILGKDNNTVRSSRNIKLAEISSVKDDNDTKDEQVIFIRISPMKGAKSNIGPVGYPVIEMMLYDKFVKNGIATIKLSKSSVQILISNCPPRDLALFLTTLKIKLGSSAATVKDLMRTNSIEKLRPQSITTLDAISPVRRADALKMQQKELAVHFLAGEKRPITPVRQKRPIDATDMMTPPNKKQRPIQLTSTPTRPLLPMSILDENKDFSRLTEHHELTKEQIAIIEKVRSGENVFFTGSAGTGKTFLLKRIIGCLPPQYTAITASTGIAASLIDGLTLHSFAGLGISMKSVKDSVAAIMNKSNYLHRWRKCKHLIIDEISMISAEFFDHLDEVVREIKGIKTVPFGGIQLILSGDFFQLPPIVKKSEKPNYKFLFQSNVWETAFKQTYFLTEVKRQSDKQFIDLLSEIRLGECSEKTKKILESTSNQKIAVDGIIPTKLCCYKDDVMKKNSASLESLKGDPVEYIAEDSVSGKDYYISQVCAAEQKVTLKIGAQVMLLKNIDVQEGLANGSRGVVVKFETSAGQLFPAVRFVGGKTVTIKPEIFSVSISIGGNLSVVVRRQIPLKLAYAITVHKSQGMTLDCVDLDVSNTFESGQAYVALSRCKSLQTMRVINWNRHCVRVDKAVKEFYEKQQDNADWP